MLHTKRSLSFELIFSAIGLLLFIGLIYFITDNRVNKIHLKEIQTEIRNSYATVMEENKKAAILLFELQFNNSEVVGLLQSIVLGKENERKLSAQAVLYQSLHFKFQISQQYFPIQKIYRSDGSPLLSLNAPYQKFDNEPSYNIGLNKVINEHISYYGLALQDGSYLYRFFFPLFDDHHALIAVVEIALPLQSIQSFLFAEHGAASQFLFSKRQLLDIRNKWKLYEEAVISDNYYVLKKVRAGKLHNMYLTEKEFLILKAGFTQKQQEALLKTEAFTAEVSLNGDDGFADFLPLRNINGDVIGHLFTYTPNPLATIHKNNRLMSSLLLLSLFLLLTFYLYRKNISNKNNALLHKEMLEALPFPMFCKDENNRYIGANRAFFKHFNIDNNTQFSETEPAFINEPEALQISAQELMDTGGRKIIHEEVIDEVGIANYETALFIVKKANQEVRGILGLITDETQRIATMKNAQEIFLRQKQIINSLPVGLRIFNMEKQVIEVNKSFEALSGYKQSELLNAPCEKLFTCLQCSPEVCPLVSSKEQGIINQIETIKYTKDNQVKILTLHFEPLYNQDRVLVGVIEISTDVSKTKRLQDKTHELIIRDELTGLLNLRGLMDVGANYFRLAERTQKPFFALHFDIHGMRKLNYQFGEKVADQVLIDFAHILKVTFRDTDLIARIGGDEFVVLLNDSDYKMVDSGHFARLESNVQKYNMLPDNEHKLLIDTGIVQYSAKTHSHLELLLEQCEKIVYEQQLKRTIS